MDEKLVERLRGVDHMSVEDCFLQSHLFAQSATALTLAHARIRELETALAARSAEPVALEALMDKIEGLESDLTSAVEVAYRRGAVEWVRLNYPRAYAVLSAHPKEAPDV